MSAVSNPAHSEPLEAAKAALEAELRARHAGMNRAALRDLFPFSAYAAYYRRFQKTYHVQMQLESVALKGKTLPRAAGLVEAMFMAELADGLLTAGHDRTALALPIRLDVANGTETYTLLNGKPQVLSPGDMFMADGEGVVSSILYGPDQRTRITPATTAVVFAIYAPPGVGHTAVSAHIDGIAANVRVIAPEAQIDYQTVVEA